MTSKVRVMSPWKWKHDIHRNALVAGSEIYLTNDGRLIELLHHSVIPASEPTQSGNMEVLEHQETINDENIVEETINQESVKKTAQKRVKVVQQIKCTFDGCDEKFDKGNYKTIRRHETEKHQDKGKINWKSPCPFCDHVSAIPSILPEHMWKKHKLRLKLLKVQGEKKCPDCGTLLKSHSVLYVHRKNHCPKNANYLLQLQQKQNKRKAKETTEKVNSSKGESSCVKVGSDEDLKQDNQDEVRVVGTENDLQTSSMEISQQETTLTNADEQRHILTISQDAEGEKLIEHPTTTLPNLANIPTNVNLAGNQTKNNDKENYASNCTDVNDCDEESETEQNPSQLIDMHSGLPIPQAVMQDLSKSSKKIKVGLCKTYKKLASSEKVSE